MKEEFISLVGPIPRDQDTFKHRHRIHQGWWRTAVLMEEPGLHPSRQSQRTCSTLPVNEDRDRRKNFINERAYLDAAATIEDLQNRQQLGSGGGLQEDRLWRNLLSSQSLMFNFWSPLKHNPDLANVVLPRYILDFQSLVDIHFEWSPAPKTKYTGDNTAFDMLIIYKNTEGNTSFLGLEVKYTDRLTTNIFDTPVYRAIFENATNRFRYAYGYYILPDYNQLFRNELLACAIEQNDGIPTRCGVFCHQDDMLGIQITNSFASALNVPYTIITYQDMISTIQQFNVSWEVREWTMLLWARYIAMSLSEATYEASE